MQTAPIEPSLLTHDGGRQLRQKSDVPALLLMVFSELLLASVNTIVKFVATWPTQRLMLVRFTIDFCLCASVCTYRGFRSASAIDVGIIALRGLSYCVGMCFFWAALRSCLPIGDVVVLVLSLSPLFLVLMARALARELIPREFPGQMCLLLLGAALISKPLAPPDGCPKTTALLPFGAATSWAFMNFAARRVPHVPSVQVMLISDVVIISFACVAALVVHGEAAAVSALRPPLDRDFLLVGLSAVVGWAGLQGNVMGYQIVSAAAVGAIAGTSSIPFNYLSQVIVFHKPLDMLSTTGAAIVVATTLGMTIAKHLAAKRQMSEEALLTSSTPSTCGTLMTASPRSEP